MGNDVLTNNFFIDPRARKIFLLEFLNNSAIDDVAGLVDGFGIKSLRCIDDDICQEV